MSLDNVTPGKNCPEAFNVIIEIPMNADPVKYEVDHETHAIFVDRFMSTAVMCPKLSAVTATRWTCWSSRRCR